MEISAGRRHPFTLHFLENYAKALLSSTAARAAKRNGGERRERKKLLPIIISFWVIKCNYYTIIYGKNESSAAINYRRFRAEFHVAPQVASTVTLALSGKRPRREGKERESASKIIGPDAFSMSTECLCNLIITPSHNMCVEPSN